MDGEWKPEVSVLLIVHNGEATLPMALRSLLLQTFERWECVVVDDASTDGTAEVLERYCDGRFRVLRLSSRQGRGAARALALQHSRADFVASLDADDFYYPEYLERQVGVLVADPDVRAVTSPLILFDSKLESLGLMRGRWPAGRYRLPMSPVHLRIPFGSTVFRREGAEGVAYQSRYPRAEDYDFYSRLLQGQTLTVGKTPLYAYRWHFGLHEVLEGLQQTERIHRASLPSSPLRASVLLGACRVKIWVYRTLAFFGLWRWTVRWRYRQASAAQTYEFEAVVRQLVVST